MIQLSFVRRLIKQSLIASLIILPAFGASTSSLRAQDAEPAPKPEVNVPEVFLSSQHEMLCKVLVGDSLPDLKLAEAKAPSDHPTPLSEQLGERATLVVFWQGEGHMAKSLLRDLTPDVIEPFKGHGVNVIVVAVNTPIGKALELTTELKYSGPVLLDRRGEGFAQVATSRLPRVFILDDEGHILWLDIEYSHSTRREIARTLAELAPEELPPEKPKPEPKPEKLAEDADNSSAEK
ncbi:MAG: TlpA family protein disulfide reductase [Aeoliella sp.]